MTIAAVGATIKATASMMARILGILSMTLFQLWMDVGYVG